MSVVIDTSVLIDVLRDVSPAVNMLQSARVNEESLCSSEIVKLEILAGMLPGEEEVTEGLLSLFVWIPLDDQTVREAAAFSRQYRDRYPKISIADYIVAATCKVTDSGLATLNIKDFPMFEGIERPY